jgi:hypothetical protein
LEDGTPFQRSAEHAMYTVTDRVKLEANARLSHVQALNADSDQISVFVKAAGPEGLQVRMYAEVYGTYKENQLRPACWIGGKNSCFCAVRVFFFFF